MGGRTSDTAAGPEGPLAIHWDGRRWTRVSVPRAIVDPALGGGGGYLSAVTAIRADDVWAVGAGHTFANESSEGLVVHWNGRRWTRGPVLGAYLTGVSADPVGTVWTVGVDDEIIAQANAYTHTGGAWSPVYADSGSYEAWFNAVAATGPTVWAVGGWATPDASGPLVERYASGQFAPVPVAGDFPDDLLSVAQVGAHAFAVGDDRLTGPAIARLRNGEWGLMHIPAGWANRSLVSIAAGSDGSVWAAGSFIARSCIDPA